MDYNFFKLNEYDINFILNNTNSLSLPTKTRLIMIKDKLNISDEYKPLKEKSDIIISKAITYNSKLIDIINKPSETLDDIVDIINSFKSIYKPIPKLMYKFTPRQYYTELFKLFYFYILKDKIRVYTILQKIIDNESINMVIFNTLTDIYDLFLTPLPITPSAISTGLFYKSLNTDNIEILQFLVYSASVMFGHDESVMMGIINKYNESGLLQFDINDDIKYTSKVTDIEPDSITDNREIYNSIDDVNIIGDNIFEDRPQFIYDLRNELVKLNIDSIKNYIGYQDNISYKIDEQSLAQLIKNDDYKITKVSIKDMGIFTIVKYNNDLYLLFELPDNTIQGISFPVGEGGRRKIIVLERDDNVFYSLKEPDID